jgi:hypothetical protein
MIGMTGILPGRSAAPTRCTLVVHRTVGYNDPIIGQGLSIALRDARTVRQVAGHLVAVVVHAVGDGDRRSGGQLL